MSKELLFVYPELGVSVNKLYTVNRGRKILTAAGRRYRNAFISQRGGLTAGKLIMFEADPEKEYLIDIWYFVLPEDLFHLKYGQKGCRAKSPFKNMDVSNLVKLNEDCVAKLVGLRDSNNFDVFLHKRDSTDGQERVVACIKPSPMENCPYESY
jgi:hypothetical protein